MTVFSISQLVEKSNANKIQILLRKERRLRLNMPEYGLRTTHIKQRVQFSLLSIKNYNYFYFPHISMSPYLKYKFFFSSRIKFFFSQSQNLPKNLTADHFHIIEKTQHQQVIAPRVAPVTAHSTGVEQKLTLRSGDFKIPIYNWVSFYLFPLELI